VLVMTVNPGFGGQKFLPECLAKISELFALREEKNLNYDIEVDGGVDNTTIALCKEKGANVFVAGSYIYNSEDIKGRIDALRKEIEDI